MFVAVKNVYNVFLGGIFSLHSVKSRNVQILVIYLVGTWLLATHKAA